MSAGERLRLRGSVAVVTGGSRGLGLAMARLLARSGATVVIGSRSADAVASAVSSLRAEGLAAVGRPCDVTDRAQIMALRDQALDVAGRLDVWVNNAGVAAAFGPVHRVSEDLFLTTTDTIIRGTYWGSLAALDAMRPAGAGHIVNLLGRGDRTPVPNQVAYASAKAWVRSFTLALARENADSGVRVQAFNPGLVGTDLLSRVESVFGFRGRLERLPAVVAVLGRTPDEAALALLELLSGGRGELSRVRPASVLGQLARRGLDRVRGVAPGRMAMTVQEVPDRPTSLG